MQVQPNPALKRHGLLHHDTLRVIGEVQLRVTLDVMHAHDNVVVMDPPRLRLSQAQASGAIDFDDEQFGSGGNGELVVSCRRGSGFGWNGRIVWTLSSVPRGVGH